MILKKIKLIQANKEDIRNKINKIIKINKLKEDKGARLSELEIYDCVGFYFKRIYSFYFMDLAYFLEYFLEYYQII